MTAFKHISDLIAHPVVTVRYGGEETFNGRQIRPTLSIDVGDTSEFLHLMDYAGAYFMSGIRIAVMITSVIVTGPTIHATSHATPLRFAKLRDQP